MTKIAWTIAIVCVLASVCVGVLVGPTAIPPLDIARELIDRLPGIEVASGLTVSQAAVVWDLRFPRVILALIVGAMLSIAVAAYQGVFRNPLVDPYLLGVAAGAGLGATLAIVSGASGQGGISSPVPIAAFVGASGAVALTYLVGSGRNSVRPSSILVLAGVAVASLLTALQTFVQQRNTDNLREVYSFILGSLSTASWEDVGLALPYVLGSAGVILIHRRLLDVLSVGDDEAATLGLDVARTRLVIVAAATLGTAAAVSVSGLIGFVGIIVPHAVRLVTGSSYRRILPLSLAFGGAFMIAADIVARTALAPSEVPLGVVTAFFGAPFFLALLRARQT